MPQIIPAFSSTHTNRSEMDIFMSTVWDAFPPHEVCREGCCPLRLVPAWAAPCAPALPRLELASRGLKRELVPNARLYAGTAPPAPRLIPNCRSVFNFPHKIRLNIWVHKSLGLRTAVNEGSAGCRLKLPTGQVYAASFELLASARRCGTA